MAGSLGVLNVSGGDITIKFDQQNVAECIRAKRMISDMLKRGYALLIEVDGKYTRCLEFKEDVGEYIVADFAPSVESEIEEINDSISRGPALRQADNAGETAQLETGTDHGPDVDGSLESKASGKPRRGRKPGRKAIKMETTNARAVARTSGG